jgi:hypothetical protein
MDKEDINYYVIIIILLIMIQFYNKFKNNKIKNNKMFKMKNKILILQ